jgi:hypothetical protein
MKTPKLWRVITLTLLTACSTSALTGCALVQRKVLVLPADRVVVAMPAGQAYTPPSDGYFVPKARMQDILDRLSEKDVLGQ